ncbi:MAG: hypothetical protein ABR543_14380 [Gemmatimonadaceae bacterium]
MSCIHRIPRPMVRVAKAVLLILPAWATLSADAQQPSPDQPTTITPYRTPRIALVQPAPGGTLPQDKPVVVFRFTEGEPADAIDAASFRVSVDSHDRSSSFRVSAAEAWGSLAAPHPDSTIAPGLHQVAARICSSRGACAFVEVPVTIAATTPTTPTATTRREKKRDLIELLIEAARKLLLP